MKRKSSCRSESRVLKGTESMVSQSGHRGAVENAEVSYLAEPLRLLRDQLVRYTPKAKRWAQVDRAEALLTDLVDATVYPFDFIHFKITGVRPAESDSLSMKGSDWTKDLITFIDDVSTSAPLDAEAVDQEVWTVEQLAKRYDVAARTINRWRPRGLVARRFHIEGRSKVGFLNSSVERFEAHHAELIARGGKFRNLDDQERETIFDQVREALNQDPEQNMMQIARRVAMNMGRSTETVRTLIKEHDVENPERALFPDLTGPLSDSVKLQLQTLFSRGVGVAALARQFRRSRQTIHRVLVEMRARDLLKSSLDYIDNPDFAKSGVAAEFAAEMPEPDAAVKRARAPKDLPPYLASLYEVPLLTKNQEQHLFRKMNFLKYQAQQLRHKVAEDPSKARSSDLDKIERLQEEALMVKNQIIRANLRLVVSIAKRHVLGSANFFELISDGNMSLMRAVEKFDFARGNKFSTYASWAIVKNFARSIPEENHHRDRFVTGHEEMFEAAADNRTDEQEIELAQKSLKQTVKGLLVQLDPRERLIIQSRFGLDGNEECTLENLGRQLGITKERVRQIEARAQEKIRRIASQEQIELPN
jgi:RNA polymerase primary sigma factor